MHVYLRYRDLPHRYSLFDNVYWDAKALTESKEIIDIAGDVPGHPIGKVSGRHRTL
jgi:hypothetical protein